MRFKSIHRITFSVFLFILIMTGIQSIHAKSQIHKEIQYLSGTDNENTVSWNFYCTGGRNADHWTTIEVPSHWEQQGFGIYNYGRDYHTYGRDYPYADEKGLYKTTFTVPKSWKKKRVNLVFEGSMTDTEVRINGELAGPIHQGSFYRFKFDVTDKLRFGQDNLLEVTVNKMSANESVNRAERYADYWIFGGIYRPVYLEAYPEKHLSHIAIAAEADGSVLVHAFPENLSKPHTIKVDILDQNGTKVTTFSKTAEPTDSLVVLRHKVENPSLWSEETPVLYKAIVSLQKGKKTIHQTSEKIGFRTVEIREGDGIYINGVKVKMKGINRHVFWPETGRCINPKIDLMDVELMKAMNMNSVRCSHYPPDKSFLHICDSLGLYVLDELAGWQNGYDTQSGEILVKEMVMRDVNHPSIIFWSNGNEGGTNKELDDDYGKYDPYNRPVIHAHHRPGNDFNGIDTNHYEDYESVQNLLNDSLIYMTTEFLHCQNDGGGGAALKDYWELMWTSPKSAGGYLWALIDEGVVRTDLNNSIDVNRVNAPDGVLGPHREKEGSFFAIQEIFSPIQIEAKEAFDGNLKVENRFDFTNLNACTFKYQLVKFQSLFDTEPGHQVLHEQIFQSESIPPHTKGVLSIPLSENWQDADCIYLTAINPFGKKILTWSWTIQHPETFVEKVLSEGSPDSIKVEEQDSLLLIHTKIGVIHFNQMNGMFMGVRTGRRKMFHFKNGPVLCGGESSFKMMSHSHTEDGYVVEVEYDGDMTYAGWTIQKNGWIKLDYQYTIKDEVDFSGVSFDFPESHMLDVKWLGKGPYRVWKNRMQGVTHNVWQNGYNNTLAGQHPWVFPEFKGYFADVNWMVFNSVDGKFIVVTPDENLFVRLFEFYGLPGMETDPPLPPGDISFLEHIPAVGTKMTIRINARAERLGPSSQLNKVDGTFSRTLYFYFGWKY